LGRDQPGRIECKPRSTQAFEVFLPNRGDGVEKSAPLS